MAHPIISPTLPWTHVSFSLYTTEQVHAGVPVPPTSMRTDGTPNHLTNFALDSRQFFTIYHRASACRRSCPSHQYEDRWHTQSSHQLCPGLTSVFHYIPQSKCMPAFLSLPPVCGQMAHPIISPTLPWTHVSFSLYTTEQVHAGVPV